MFWLDFHSVASVTRRSLLGKKAPWPRTSPFPGPKTLRPSGFYGNGHGPSGQPNPWPSMVSKYATAQVANIQRLGDSVCLMLQVCRNSFQPSQMTQKLAVRRRGSPPAASIIISLVRHPRAGWQNAKEINLFYCNSHSEKKGFTRQIKRVKKLAEGDIQPVPDTKLFKHFRSTIYIQLQECFIYPPLSGEESWTEWIFQIMLASL